MKTRLKKGRKRETKKMKKESMEGEISREKRRQKAIKKIRV